ncbi:hypothetical protein IAT40_003726 [Kwoniella sp. CBS 6097]
MLVKYPVHFVEATRDHGRLEPEFEVVIEVEADQPLDKAFDQVHQKFHPDDKEKHKYTFLLQAPTSPPIVINGNNRPSDFPHFSKEWKIIAIDQEAK